MEEAGVEVITAEVKGGDASVKMTNETACQVAWLQDRHTQKIILLFLLVQVEILGMLTALTADITEQAHGIDPWDSSGDTKCKNDNSSFHPFFVYKFTTENFRSGGFCNVHGKDRRSCHREHFHRNGEAYQLPSKTKISYSKIKQYLRYIDIPNQIYWDDGEVTDENDTETNSFWFTHTYADVSTNLLY